MAIKIKPQNMFDFYVLPGGGAKIADHFLRFSNSQATGSNTSTLGSRVEAGSSPSSSPDSSIGRPEIPEKSVNTGKVLFWVCGIAILGYIGYRIYNNYKGGKEKEKNKDGESNT